ncbi:MAG: hypothetical protein ACHQ50_17470, partial [Fimbriimonadales bacterium]
CMESAVDPADNGYLRGAYFKDLQERRRQHESPGGDARLVNGQQRPQRLRSEFERFKYGIAQRLRIGKQGEGVDDWVNGHPLVFPAMVRLGTGFRNELQIRVPIDDTHTWNLHYQCFRPGEGVDVPRQESVPLYQIPLKDEQGEFIFSVAGIRDMVLWTSQGEILDRTREHLVDSDQGVLLYRRLLQQQVSIVEDGGEPMNVFRNGADMGSRVDLEPDQPSSQPTTGAFNPEDLEDDVERYSPAIDEVAELYRRMIAFQADATESEPSRGSI